MSSQEISNVRLMAEAMEIAAAAATKFLNAQDRGVATAKIARVYDHSDWVSGQLNIRFNPRADKEDAA